MQGFTFTSKYERIFTSKVNSEGYGNIDIIRHWKSDLFQQNIHTATFTVILPFRNGFFRVPRQESQVSGGDQFCVVEHRQRPGSLWRFTAFEYPQSNQVIFSQETPTPPMSNVSVVACKCTVVCFIRRLRQTSARWTASSAYRETRGREGSTVVVPVIIIILFILLGYTFWCLNVNKKEGILNIYLYYIVNQKTPSTAISNSFHQHFLWIKFWMRHEQGPYCGKIWMRNVFWNSTLLAFHF